MSVDNDYYQSVPTNSAPSSGEDEETVQGDPPFDTTRTSSTSQITVLSVSPSPLASLVGLNMVVYSRWRFEKSRGHGRRTLTQLSRSFVTL